MARRKMRALIIAVAVITTLAGPLAQGSLGADLSDAELAWAIGFRQTMGLRADPADAAVAAQDQDAFPNMMYGVPLTESEAALLDERAALQAKLGPAIAFATEQPSSAGAYFDPLTGQPVFTFVGEPAAYVKGLMELLPAGASFRVEQVKYSHAELDSTKAAISAEVERGATPGGARVILVGIDESHDVVIVGVEGLTPDVAEAMTERYGDIVKLRDEGPISTDSCTSRSNCGSPVKGGLRIEYTSTRWCTSGFIGKVRNSIATLRVITAGHCIQLNGGVGASWKHAGTTFGTADMERYYSGTNADVGTITYSTGAQRNLFYASGPSDIRATSGWRTNQTQLVGDTICRGGATTGYRCGTIHARDVDRLVEGLTVHHSYEVTFDASPGDSGAPYFFGSTAYGIHTDSTDDGAPGTHYAWYSTVGWTLSEAYISYCFNATCSG